MIRNNFNLNTPEEEIGVKCERFIKEYENEFEFYRLCLVASDECIGGGRSGTHIINYEIPKVSMDDGFCKLFDVRVLFIPVCFSSVKTTKLDRQRAFKQLLSMSVVIPSSSHIIKQRFVKFMSE